MAPLASTLSLAVYALPQKAHEETDDASAGQGYTVCIAPSPMGVVLPAWVMSY